MSVFLSCPDSPPKALGPLNDQVKAIGHLAPSLPGVRELSLVSVSTAAHAMSCPSHWLTGCFTPELSPNYLQLPSSIFLLLSPNKNMTHVFFFLTTTKPPGENLTFYLEFNFLNVLPLFDIPIIPTLFEVQLMKFQEEREDEMG